MNSNLLWSLCCALVVTVSVTHSHAQTEVVISLDLFYTDNSGDDIPDATSNGTWQLYALAEGEGLAALDVAITGIVGSPGNEFAAPTPAFKKFFAGGSSPYDTDQDADASTLDMLFTQVPVTAPGPQDIQYDVGKIGGSTPNTDELGIIVDTSGTSMTDAVLLAFGTFGAGSTPAVNLSPGISGANVFTVEGTATQPPPLGTILTATPFTAQTRTNLGTLKGDVNLDGTFVDGADFGLLAAGFDAGVSTDKTWQDGDVTGDKRVDAADAGQVFGAWTGDHPPAAPGSASGHYNSATGEIVIDVDGVVNWYVEYVGGAWMTGDAPVGLNPANGLITDNDVRIGQSGFAQFSYDDLNLGNVAQPGLNPWNFRIYWNTELGSKLQSALMCGLCPEPATFMMLTIGGCSLLSVRRNRMKYIG